MLRRIKMALPLFFAFVLTFLPFQLLRFTQSQRDTIQQERSQYLWEQRAHNYLQKFSTCWSFELQLQRKNEEMRRQAEQAILQNQKKPGRMLAFHINNIFTKDYSPELIYGCELNKKNKKLRLFKGPFYAEKKRVVFKRIFSALLSSGDLSFNKQLNTFIGLTFGDDVDFRLLKVHRRGKTVSVVYEKSNMVLIWDKFENKERALGFMCLFRADKILQNRSILIAQQKFLSEYPDISPVLVPVREANESRSVIFSPQTDRNVKATVEKILAISENEDKSRSEILPIGKTVLFKDFTIIREFIDFSLPYELWMFRVAAVDEKSGLGQKLMLLLNIFFYASWILVFARVFITAHPLGFSLENWLKLIFIVIGVIPLIVLYIAGSFHIESTAFTEEQQMIRETVKLFEEADVSGESVLAEYRRLCRKIENSDFWKNAMLQWDTKAWEQAIDKLPELFSRSDLEITACYIFPPPVSGLDVYFKTFNPHSSGRDGPLSRMYSGWINKAYSKIDPVLTLNQKTDVSLFAGRESDEVLRLFMGNRGDVDMLIMGEDRQYFYQNYVLENKIPKNWFFLRSNLKESMKKHLYRKTLNWNKLNQEIIFGLVHKNYPEVDYIYPAPEAEVGSKIFKRFERHAGKIIDIAGMTSARIFEYDDQNLVFVYPCRKAGDFILAAIITFRDLKQRSFVRELLLGIILILLSIPVLMISGFMVKYLVLPLKEVEQGLKKIGEEDFSSRMRIRRQDELGELAMAFDGMMDGIIERKNLGRFVSANLDTRVSDENSSLTGKLEKNFAAVLCSDIRSFTTLSEEHEAREIVEMLNGHLSQMSGCIREHEGKVEQFIGDAVLAIFFGETDHKAVSNALDAARAMMSIHKKNIEQRKSMGKFFFDIGIGIEADHIISGALKLDEKSEYVLVGKARYMAEELEGKSRFAKHSRIICSDNVKQLALNYKFEQLKDTEHWELINGENDS